MAVEPGHSLPCTRLPFPNWKNILLTPLKTHCRSKTSRQSPRSRHRMTLNPQRLFTEKKISCSSVRDAVHSWASEHRVRQGKRYTSILQNPWEVLLCSLSRLFTKTTQKFCFLHTDWKDKLLWKKTVFEIIFYISKQWTIWCGEICTALLAGSILFDLYIVKFSQACTHIHPTLHFTQILASKLLWELLIQPLTFVA